MSDGLISGKIVSRGLFLLIFEATNGRQEQELHFAPSIVSFTDLPTVGDGDEVFVVEAEAAEVGAELGVALLRPRVARVEQHGQAQRLSTRQTTGRPSHSFSVSGQCCRLSRNPGIPSSWTARESTATPRPRLGLVCFQQCRLGLIG